MTIECTNGNNVNTTERQDYNLTFLMNECMRLALQESDPNRGIQRLIEYLGQELNAARAYIFELSKQNEWNNTYEWCACDVSSEMGMLQGIPYNTIDIWLRSFHDNQFVAIRNLELIKETDPEVYEYLKPQNIDSIIVGPLYEADRLVGFYGIDNPPADKLEQSTTMIKTVSYVIETMLNKRELIRRLEDLSYHDQMLKLGNRHAMKRYLDTIDRTRSIGIVYCDVCGLKRVNDTMGHAAGDELLLHACECLKEAFPDYGLYRVGGDEMLALISGREEADFEDECNNLRLLMLERDMPLAIGAVWKPCLQGTVQELIAEADARMYQDKVHFYKDVGLNKWRSNFSWFGTTTKYEEIVECVNSGLEKALAEGQFDVYYQPQYNQRDHSLYGAEALVRWIHPQKGLIPPSRFIPYLEQNGMISKLDEYVLQETCRNQKRWLEQGVKIVPVSVNLSRVDLQNDEICYRTRDTLQEFGLKPEWINLEVTESAYIENPESVIEVVQKFQQFGFKVEMDDFGSGYSSLNSLKEIPVDILKMDMKFVEGIHIGERGGKILSAIIRMAHDLGMPIIAEGVETREQAVFLSEVGCLYMQGYYFDRPLPVEIFEEKLMGSKPDLERDRRFTRRMGTEIDYFAGRGEASLLLDNAMGPAGIIAYNGTSIELIRSNDALYDLLGVTDDESLHNLYENVFYKRNVEIYIQAINAAIETMDSSECVTQNVKLGNQKNPFWIRTRFKYLYGYDKHHIFYITAENVNEITTMKQTNTMLFQILEELQKRGTFGAVMLQIGECDIISYFNAEAAAILGYSVEEYRDFINKDAYANVFPEDREKLKNKIRQTFSRDSGMMSCNIRHMCKNGEIKNIPVIGIAGMNADGPKYIRILMLDKPVINQLMKAHDINELNQLTDELKDMEAVMEIVGGAYICCSKQEEMILHVSREMHALLGYLPGNMKALQYKSLNEIIWPNDWGYVHRRMSEAKKKHQKIMVLEFRVQTRRKEKKWVRAVYHVAKKSNNREDIYLTFTDIDEAKHFKDERMQQKHLDYLIETNPTVGVTYYQIIGKRWRVDYINKGYLSIFGYTKEELLHLTSNDLLALVHPDDREKVRKHVHKCLKTRQSYKIRYRMLNAEGEYVGMLSYSNFSEYGGELYLCQTNIDISWDDKGRGDYSFRVYE